MHWASITYLGLQLHQRTFPRAAPPTTVPALERCSEWAQNGPLEHSLDTPIATRDDRMADGGRDRCFEDVVCILFNDENQATVVVSMVIQLLQPPLPLCVNVGAVSLVDRCGAIQYVQ